MDDIKSTLLLALVIITGVFTAPTCYNYLTARSQEIGIVKDLQKTEYVEEKDNYSITYNLDGGVVENNPDEYNLFTETFTLNNPTKQGYKFIGWTNQTITEPTLTVTICMGSAGDIEFTANYELLIAAPAITLSESEHPEIVLEWQAVENAEKYHIYRNDICWDYVTGTTYKYSPVNYESVGAFSFKVVAERTIDDEKVQSAFSNEINVNLLERPSVTITDNELVSWNQVTEATSYIVKLSKGQFETTQTSFNLSDYNNLLTDEYFQFVYIYAINENSTSMPGSQGFTYESAVIDTTITVPYTIHVKYKLYPEEEQTDYSYNGVYLGIKYADVTISFENNGKTYSLTQICTTQTDFGGNSYHSTPLLVADMQNLAEWMSFAGCTFDADSVGNFIWHLDNYADDYFRENPNREICVDLGYKGTDWQSIEVTTQDKTGFPAHLVYTFVIEQYS